MKSWKTTLFGAITACGMGLSQIDDPILKTIGQILAIVGPALMGIFTKDADVTGGTVQQ